MDNKDKINLVTTSEIFKSCLQAAQCINFLEGHEFIDKLLANLLREAVKKKENEHRVFITKPFIRNEGMQKDLYVMMRALQRRIFEKGFSIFYEDKQT